MIIANEDFHLLLRFAALVFLRGDSARVISELACFIYAHYIVLVLSQALILLSEDLVLVDAVHQAVLTQIVLSYEGASAVV